MNRHDLSDFVIQLTDSATRLGPLDFNRDLIRLVRSIARFDSAWWGWSVIRERHLSFVHSQTLNLAPGFVDSAKAQLETDPFMHRARRLRHFAQALSAKDVESNSPAAAVMRDYGIAQALAGHCRVGDGPFNFFMSLYRSSPTPRFTAEETGDVRILLRHVQQALALSLRLTLGSQVDRGEEWALADAGGELFLHSSGFPSLHRRSGRAELQRLPLDLPVTRAGVVFRSRRYSDDVALVRAVSGLDRPELTAREREVCRLYLDGLSRREVAEALGRSENTVRNQIAAIYRKTGCRDRMGLLHAVRDTG